MVNIEIMKKPLKTLGWVLGSTVVIGAVVLGTLKVYMDATYFNGYEPSAPLHAEIEQTEEKDGIIYTKLYFGGFKRKHGPTLLALTKING